MASALLEVAAVLLAAALAAGPGAGPRAKACPKCPDDAVFLDCAQGARKATFAVGSGERGTYSLAGWSRGVEIGARRTSSGALELELTWRAADGKPASRAATLALGQAMTVWAEGGQDRARYGGSSEPLRCTWVE